MGPDAMAFRALWHGVIAPGLRAKAEDLQGRGEEIRRHAEEQDEASAGDGDGLPDVLRDLFLMPFPGPLMPAARADPRTAPHPGRHRPPPQGPRGLVHRRRRRRASGVLRRSRLHLARREVRGRPTDRRADHRRRLAVGRARDRRELRIPRRVRGIRLQPRHQRHHRSVRQRDRDPRRAGSAEIGIDDRLEGPLGTGIQAGARVGAEGYAEAGGTVGPDGLAAGARAGLGAYSAQYATVDGPLGNSGTTRQDLYAGANASANAYSHVTRNEDGQVNGFSQGFDARAFAGAQATQTFEATAPGGWFSGSTSISEKVGYGVGAGAGQTISTDEISVSVAGSIAKDLGLGGSTTVAVHPNQIVNTFTPGDYDIDDAIGDASGAFQGATDYVSDKWPF
ncbi:hypothetical protein [Brachybacterium sp. GPGPB12]|uniref:hypothetical protein n=1 Tax=Brachybacterium sp. GPGPB12 TaxID=3023517 RepID=UPI0031343A16